MIAIYPMEEIYRIIDANLNRVSEGLRVVEEVVRFVVKDEQLTKKLKAQRHKLSELFKDYELIKFRDTSKDLGKYGDFDDPSHCDLKALVQKNFKRAQEGCRAIEEFSKLFNPDITPKIKEIRFNIYELGKEVIVALKND
ncbi:MAG: thiamine-phosphate pyrophosphorylase [Candidatus Stahlbacteria bacterium]|nr:thiamine-phosphate pyrophosphorylase [Candidatus Stahlbacteria bacterium]